MGILPGHEIRRGAVAAWLLACLACASGWTTAARGDGEGLEQARRAHNEGRFLEAAGIGEALKTAEGLALAAESLAIHAHYLADGEEETELLSRAMRLAAEAIQIDPDNPQGHLQSAHAMGRYTQAVGTLQVKRDYATRVRAAIERALLLDSGLAEAHLSLATWHAEAVAGGGFLARVLYGASGKDAIAHFEQALQLAPNSNIAHAEYANGLLLLDERKHSRQARELLERAVELPAQDAHEEIVRERALATLERLE